VSYPVNEEYTNINAEVLGVDVGVDVGAPATSADVNSG
jgi:hypothetical protein